jgi:hypothetical protein
VNTNVVEPQLAEIFLKPSQSFLIASSRVASVAPESRNQSLDHGLGRVFLGAELHYRVGRDLLGDRKRVAHQVALLGRENLVVIAKPFLDVAVGAAELVEHRLGIVGGRRVHPDVLGAGLACPVEMPQELDQRGALVPLA